MVTLVERLEFETMLLGRHLTYDTRRGAGTDHLDRSAYLLLRRIAIQAPLSIGELADAFGLDTSTLNRQTRALVAAGYLDRIPDPDGGVARKFRITDAGRRQMDDERDRNVRGMAAVLADWDDVDMTALADLLRRLNIDIEHRKGHAWPRIPVAPSPEDRSGPTERQPTC